MATVLARLHLSTIAGSKQQLLHALRRSPAHQLVLGRNAIPLLCSAPLVVGGGGRRLKYNAAAGVSLGDVNVAAEHHVIGALDDELGMVDHHSGGAGSSPPSASSREYHSVAETEAAADGDGSGGEKMATRPARGGSKAALLLGWGEPLPGGGPHYN